MKPWKNAASLILAAHQKNIGKINHAVPSVPRYDYNILCLKRHPSTRAFPGTYVFPGGVIHPADADLKWRELFAKFGFDENNFASFFSNTALRPPILNPQNDELPREISLRITAIRETFEECGILLCKQSNQKEQISTWAKVLLVAEDMKKIQDWQKKVHNDATEFYKLCETLNCYPDLWSLHEWSNWLTPTFSRVKRFDTIFFIACAKDLPFSLLETTEMVDLTWDTPINFLHPESDVVLPVPQHYEFARIAKFDSVDSLLDFAAKRSKLGTQLFLSMQCHLSDGKVYVLPGDSMYPADVSLTEKKDIHRTDITISEFRELSAMRNRIEFHDIGLIKVEVQNVNNQDGHLPSISSESTCKVVRV